MPRKHRPNLSVRALERVVEDKSVSGTILSVGSSPFSHDVLNFRHFRNSDDGTRLVGINIDQAHTGIYGNFVVIAANAHDIPFVDACFDHVIAYQMLEHDPTFWVTLGEIRRVLKPGGLFIAGAPAFSDKPLGRRVPFLPGWGSRRCDIGLATLTYSVHAAPDDYYRFTKAAFEQAVFDGFSDVTVIEVMIPPRVLGWGTKPRQ